MVSNKAQDGHGTTVTFATSALAFRIVSVDVPESVREAIDATVMSTEDAMEFVAADLLDNGSLVLSVDADGSEEVMNLPAETVSIDLAGTGNVLSFTAFGTNWKLDPNTTGDRQTASFTLKVSGAITVTTGGTRAPVYRGWFTTAALPATGNVEFDTAFDTTTAGTKYWNGAAWVVETS